MQEPLIPLDEAERLASLRRLQILDTPPEERFDRVTRVARRVFGAPISLVSLVDSERQWFKSSQGLQATETPRAISFCAHAILTDKPLLVTDAREDPRFSDNPMVSGPPHIRFYAGCPISDRDGHNLGALCIIDTKTRRMAEGDLELLQDLASIVDDELNSISLNRANALLFESEKRLRDFFDNAHDLIQCVTPEGRFVFVNRAWREVLGYGEQEVPALRIRDIIHPDSWEHCAKLFQSVLSGASLKNIDALFVSKAGRTIHVSGNANMYTEANGQSVSRSIFRDVTDRNKAEAALRKSHEELETRVRERTQELTKVNEVLQAEIRRRRDSEAALQEANTEMERKVQERTRKLCEANAKLQELDQLKSWPQCLMSSAPRSTRSSGSSESICRGPRVSSTKSSEPNFQWPTHRPRICFI